MMRRQGTFKTKIKRLRQSKGTTKHQGYNLEYRRAHAGPHIYQWSFVAAPAGIQKAKLGTTTKERMGKHRRRRHRAKGGQ